MRGGLFKTVRREKIRAIDLHDLHIKNGSAGLLDGRPFGEDQDLCIKFTYERLPRLSKIRTGERMVRLTTLETSYLVGPVIALKINPVTTFKEERMVSRKQRRAARKNIKKAVKAAKRKQTLKHLPKRTRKALGKQAAKVRNSQR